MDSLIDKILQVFWVYKLNTGSSLKDIQRGLALRFGITVSQDKIEDKIKQMEEESLQDIWEGPIDSPEDFNY